MGILPDFLATITMLVVVVLVSGCAFPVRENPPPEGEVFNLPWGSVNTDVWDVGDHPAFTDEAIERWSNTLAELRENDPAAKMPYRMLALSGGGSRGAFGAGVLSGWTQTGTRPQFDVVTGISTGALMATPAYLGSSYDPALTLFTTISNSDVYTRNSKLAFINKEAMYDTAPLRSLLADHLDTEMIDAVGREFQGSGRTLFIGTTNLDAKVFTIWDMGKIASSDNPKRYEMYRDIVLASASFPIVFPPVFLPATTADGESYYQMHADGGLRETIFLYDYLGEYKKLVESFGLDWEEDLDFQIFMLYNGKIFEDETYIVVDPNTLSIAMRSLYTLMRTAATASIFQVWSGSLAHGATVHLASIPEHYDTGAALDFDTAKMRRLYQLGYQQALQHIAWQKRPPPNDMEDFRQSLDLYDKINPIMPDMEADLEALELQSAPEL